MGRRDQGIIDDVIEIAAGVPIAGVVLAIAFAGGGAYFQWMNPKVMMGFGRVFALFFWALAGVSAVAAVFGSVWQQFDAKRRNRRLDSQHSIDDLRRLSPGGFEQTIGDLFRRQGFRVDEVGGAGDGGVDLILRRGGDKRRTGATRAQRRTGGEVHSCPATFESTAPEY